MNVNINFTLPGSVCNYKTKSIINCYTPKSFISAVKTQKK